MFWKTDSSPANKPTARSKDSFPSVITKDMHILGNILSDGVVDFNGSIEGNIRCRTITLRADGSVNGEVVADNAFIYGKVNGLLRAKHVHLFASCHIEGIIMHESLMIEDGAFIDGKCKRMDKVSEDEGSSDNVVPAPIATIPVTEEASPMPMLESKSKKSAAKGKVIKYSIISG